MSQKLIDFENQYTNQKKIVKKYKNQPEFKLCQQKTTGTLSRPASEITNNSFENYYNDGNKMSHVIFGTENDINEDFNQCKQSQMQEFVKEQENKEIIENKEIQKEQAIQIQNEHNPKIQNQKKPLSFSLYFKNTLIIILSVLVIYLMINIIQLNEFKTNQNQSENKWDEVDFSLNISYEEFYEQTKLKPLSQLQAKCSHNSFEAGDYYNQLKFDKQNAYQGGSLMLEFDIMHDIQENKEDYEFFMSHLQNSHDGQTLNEGLQQVQKFHNKNKNHLPIFITLNIKPQLMKLEYGFDSELFYNGLEKTLTSIFNQKDIFSPKQMIKNGEKNLFEAAQNSGYPQVSELLGKFVIILDASQEDNNDPNFYEQYEEYINQIDTSLMWGTLDTKLIQRVYYSSLSQYIEETQNYNKIFVNIKSNYFYNKDKSAYLKGLDVLKEAQQLNLMTRGYVLNNMHTYIKQRELGMNFLCTDKIFDHSFAVAY